MVHAEYEGGFIAEKNILPTLARYVIFFCNDRYLPNSQESSKKHFIVYVYISLLTNSQIGRKSQKNT